MNPLPRFLAHWMLQLAREVANLELESMLLPPWPVQVLRLLVGSCVPNKTLQWLGLFLHVQLAGHHRSHRSQSPGSPLGRYWDSVGKSP